MLHLLPLGAFVILLLFVGKSVEFSMVDFFVLALQILAFVFGFILFRQLPVRRRFDIKILQDSIVDAFQLWGIRFFHLASELALLNQSVSTWYDELETVLPWIHIGIITLFCGISLAALWLNIFTPIFSLFLALSAVMIFYTAVRIFLLFHFRAVMGGLLSVMRLWGWAQLLTLGIIAGVGVALRFDPAARSTFALLYVFGACVSLYIVRWKSPRRIAVYINVLTVGTLPRLFWAWAVCSLLITGEWGFAIGNTWFYHNRETFAATLENRPDNSQSRIAVALSGGGYRAALVHAGILSSLDQAGIKIRYLSTVSGGSIVGGAYAIGMKPEEFARRMALQAPRLSDDILSMPSVLFDLFGQDWTRTNTYDLHLRRILFHWHDLSEARNPTLIVNTTKYSDGTRQIFSSGEHLPIATAVAASGAFPVAFEPLIINGERYVDGGVVENLGLEGLRVFLQRKTVDEAPTPEALIISDMSKAAPNSQDKRKVFFFESANRAIDLLFQSLHRELYDRYTNGQYNRNAGCPLSQPFVVDASHLWPGRSGAVKVFIMDPTSPAEQCRFAQYARVTDDLLKMDTLKELNPTQVRTAYWAGEKVALEYMDSICKISSRCTTLKIPDISNVGF